MSSKLVTVLLLMTSCLLVPPVHSTTGEVEPPDSKKYTFLYFVSMIGGSHYPSLSMSGKELVRQGHRVVSLFSSSSPPQMHTADADIFTTVVYTSSVTPHHRADVMAHLGKLFATGVLTTFWGPLIAGVRGDIPDELSTGDMWLRECDDLLGDAATMKRLREEKFDMLVADGYIPCIPLLAQALNIPFIYNCAVHAVPSKHGMWAGLPIDPSYIPERVLGLTDRMTFIQRVQNVLAHTYYKFWRFLNVGFRRFDQLKVKYNIRPELSTYESNKQASLYMFDGSFALEFPRPMQPNTIYVLFTAGSALNKTIEADVAEFLDTAPSGVALFSLGTHVGSMEREKAQVLADGLALLPVRVLWQTSAPLPAGLRLAVNTKVVRWLPMSQVMEHPNVKVLVSHGGGFSMYEALWAGLPMVGLPFFGDQMDNLDRLEDRGVGLRLDITTITPDVLNQTIHNVITDPKFRTNARRLSLIMRDLQTMSPPVKTAAHWILHVTKFGGDHLRPAVQDLNYIQRNLIDVYLFILAVLALIVWVNLSLCYYCCRCMWGRAGKNHLKKD
ncbi:UDP-glucuronosyltransferase 2B10-like [Patiria miniata]|uniref:UDP-glycosyltransferases domain-containing protein n=1 Tax=Patiria miniata TaxID=46514 RepID=A0A913Z3B7_PATMI|nr:UDP-glucuronosyltransferase 2B10-like [Patiria miniata]